jgi:hypothetical protein
MAAFLFGFQTGHSVGIVCSFAEIARMPVRVFGSCKAEFNECVLKSFIGRSAEKSGVKKPALFVRAGFVGA